MEMLLCGRYRFVFKLNSIQFKILKAKYNVKESPLTCSNTFGAIKTVNGSKRSSNFIDANVMEFRCSMKTYFSHPKPRALNLC